MILLIVYHSRQKTNKGRMQVYILTSSGFVLAILSWMADYLFGYRGTSNIIPFWLLVWIGILLYIIKKIPPYHHHAGLHQQGHHRKYRGRDHPP